MKGSSRWEIIWKIKKLIIHEEEDEEDQDSIK